MLCAILIPQVGAVISGCSARLIIINQPLRLENLEYFLEEFMLIILSSAVRARADSVLPSRRISVCKVVLVTK